MESLDPVGLGVGKVTLDFSKMLKPFLAIWSRNGEGAALWRQLDAVCLGHGGVCRSSPGRAVQVAN